MKEALGGVWIINIILFFMVLMISYIGITVNYTRAVRVKSDIISVLEEFGNVQDAVAFLGTNDATCKMDFVGETTGEDECGSFWAQTGYDASLIDIKPMPSEISFAKACKFSVAVPLSIVIPVIDKQVPIYVKGNTKTIYNGTGECGSENITRGE